MNVLKVEEIFRFSQNLDKFPVKGVWNCGMDYNNGWLFACRNTISSRNFDYYGKINQGEGFSPVLARFDEDFNFLSAAPAVLSQDEILEDCKLFRWKGNLYSCGTKRSGKSIDQFLARVIDNTFLFLPLKHNYLLRQKNWAPIPLDSLYFEMSPANPRRIVKYNHNSIELVKEQDFKFSPHLRGNYVVDCGDFFLSFYHCHAKRTYYHICGILDKKFNIQKLSKPFTFSVIPDKVQFLMGAILKKDELILSYGVADSDNVVAKCKLDDLFTVF